MHLVFELVGSRFTAPADVPALVAAADLQSNVAVVLGPKMEFGDLPEFGEQDIVLLDNGVELARTAGNGTTAQMLDAIAWLANHARARGLPWKPLPLLYFRPMRPINPPGGSGNPRCSGFIQNFPGTLPVSEYSRPIYQSLCLDHFETPRHVRDHIRDSEQPSVHQNL